MDRDAEKIISIMDTTLRDGEQTPDISYTPPEKLHVARMLLNEVGVDRIEIVSARASRGEMGGARRVTDWARKAHLIGRVEMLGFCDGNRSVDWIRSAGGLVINLLTKGSERHCREQLGMSPEQHIQRIVDTVNYAREQKVRVNVYLEDWSNGIRDGFDYVRDIVDALRELEVERVLLADTLGVLAPDEVRSYVSLMTVTWPNLDFDFHGHNDYGLATANAIAAIQSGAVGVHTSVNGLGERAGNTSLAEIVTAIADHTTFRTNIDESRLASVSQLVETFSGKNISANTPILGADVFTQTAGIHADGDAKGDLYATRLAPQRFGRERRYALGKLSGKASLDHNLAWNQAFRHQPQEGPRQDHRARRQEAHRCSGRSADDHCGRFEDAGGTPGANRPLQDRRGVLSAARRVGQRLVQGTYGHGFRYGRRRLRCLHECAAACGLTARNQAARAR